ncbi:hypothetical protein ARMSODRAFT_1023750 [Armillaria solidipes]|uniref:Uncharacterized protein n=1 Tax=Armillaria solidipes TaxID=1076256 RepID=A0A2H3AYS8_9AGAR|nr:hypothetical protein ARMSODRAFT_1023750 [Armillaria solidipes]
MSKDCPKKRDFKDIRSVITAEQEQTKEKDASSTKIEEVKETATNTFLSSTHVVSTVHSNIPRLRAPLLTSTARLAPQSPNQQNRYAALAVEECNDNDSTLKGSNNGSPARAQAKAVDPAGHGAESPTDACCVDSAFKANRRASSLRGETQPAKASDEKSPTIAIPVSTAGPNPRPGALVVDLRQIQPSVARISRYIFPMCSKNLSTGSYDCLLPLYA